MGSAFDRAWHLLQATKSPLAANRYAARTRYVLAKIVLALPGSENAVRLGLEGILVGELKHLLWELRRYT